MTYIGRLVTGKGLDILLNAAQRILIEKNQKACVVLIVGDGPLRTDLEQLSQQLNISDQVVFTGFRRDIPDILDATDIFVLPSLTEGLPLSLMEAMASGKAVIATNVGGIPELIDPDVNGVIISPNELTALINAISSLLDDQARCKELGFRAKIYANCNFGLTRMIRSYDEIYQRYCILMNEHIK